MLTGNINTGFLHHFYGMLIHAVLSYAGRKSSKFIALEMPQPAFSHLTPA